MNYIKINKKFNQISVLSQFNSSIWIIYCLLSVSTILALLVPIFYSAIISDLLEKNIEMSLFHLVIFTVISIIEIFIKYFTKISSLKTKNELSYKIKMDMYKKLINLHIMEFKNTGIGEFMSRINSDAMIFSEGMIDKVPQLVIELFRLIGIFFIIFLISPYIAIIQLILTVLYITISKVYGKKLIDKNFQLKILYDKYFSITQQGFRGIKDIKVLGLKNYHLSEVENISIKISKKSVDMEETSVKSNTFISAINLFQISVQILIGTYLIYCNVIDGKEFIALLFYTQQLSYSINSLTQANSIISSIVVSFNRILELIQNNKYTKESFGKEIISKDISDIKFEDVTFGYTNQIKTLSNITYNILCNTKVAIVGRSGVGKSTLLDLLVKLNYPFGGSIKINGVNIENLSEEWIRKNISIVTQEPFLFNKTIKENLLMVEPYAKDDEIIEACKKAHIYDYIETLPNKLDTNIGENGVKLSVGQKQRISIARVLLRKTKIILFDEITSALDNESQFFINKTISELSREYTIIVVSHKISNILDYDQIVVINNGTIEDIGIHEELLRKNNLYKQLYENEVNIDREGLWRK